MEKRLIDLKVSDSIARIALNDPENFNILTEPLKEELIDCLKSLDPDDSVKVFILTGRGKAFCAGGDIRGFKRRYEGWRRSGGAPPYYDNRLAHAIHGISKPIIAAINGPAIGGGLSLVLACDIRIASEKASFNAAYLRMGLTPEIGSSFILPRLIGLGKAFELVMTAKDIDAYEAEKIGLVNKVVPEDKLQQTAKQMAEIISGYSLVAIKMAKKALRYGIESDLKDSIDYETQLITYCFSTKEHYEAVKRFLDKRRK